MSENVLCTQEALTCTYFNTNMSHIYKATLEIILYFRLKYLISHKLYFVLNDLYQLAHTASLLSMSLSQEALLKEIWP